MSQDDKKEGFFKRHIKNEEQLQVIKYQGEKQLKKNFKYWQE